MRANDRKLPEVHGCHVVSGLRLLCVGKVECLKRLLMSKLSFIPTQTESPSHRAAFLFVVCFFFLLLMTGVRALAEVIHLP